MPKQLGQPRGPRNQEGWDHTLLHGLQKIERCDPEGCLPVAVDR